MSDDSQDRRRRAVGAVMALYYGISKKVPAVTVVSAAVGFSALFALTLSAALAASVDRKTRARWLSYLYYTYDDKTDYAAEIAKIRENYAADDDPNKNRIPKPNFAGARPFCDTSVLSVGTVRYAALVEANEELFEFKPHKAHQILPIVVVYGTDAYFDENPKDLKKIAEALLLDSDNNFLKDETKYFSNIKLPPDTTDGREVYATVVLTYRYHLPFGVMQGDYAIFPVIAEPEKSRAAFIVDSEYWTPPIIAEYCGLREIDPFEDDGESETETETEIITE